MTDSNRGLGLGLALVATLFFIAASHLLAASLDLGSWLPARLAPTERRTLGFLCSGALAQASLVLALALVPGLGVRQSIRAVFRPSNVHGWTIAIVATAIQIVVLASSFLPPSVPWLELSIRNLVSLVAAIDGWSQEVVFRGMVLGLLSRAGFGASTQVLLSGAAFSAIHLGYAGTDFWGVFWPFAGTFVLGCFYARAVQVGGGSLRAVVVCHCVLIVAVQPWLALDG